MVESAERRENLLQQSKRLVGFLEAGDDKGAESILVELSAERETELYQEVGKLTRELHNNLNNFSTPENLSSLAEKEIPDAKERLNYVIEMTDEAAHATLNAIDDILPVSNDISERSKDLYEKWNRFTCRQMPYEEFKTMAAEISEYLNVSTDGTDAINKKLNEVMMAQGYQDLTGQVIRKVITLVQDVETSLVELIRLSRTADEGKSDEKKHTAKDALEGPAVPGIQVEGAVNSQDEVDDLLSSLGF